MGQGLKTLICREMVEAGEVLVRRRLGRAGDDLRVPLQLQVPEADFLDATKSGAICAGRLVQGTFANRRKVNPDDPGAEPRR